MKAILERELEEALWEEYRQLGVTITTESEYLKREGRWPWEIEPLATFEDLTPAKDAREVVTTALHRHAFCAHVDQPRFDRWEEAVGGGTLSGAFGIPTGLQMMADAITNGCCPECQTKLDLQDRARGVWWCAMCRMHIGQDLIDAALAPRANVRRCEPARRDA